jgi:hypothetical protein
LKNSKNRSRTEWFRDLACEFHVDVWELFKWCQELVSFGSNFHIDFLRMVREVNTLYLQ